MLLLRHDGHGDSWCHRQCQCHRVSAHCFLAQREKTSAQHLGIRSRNIWWFCSSLMCFGLHSAASLWGLSSFRSESRACFEMICAYVGHAYITCRVVSNKVPASLQGCTSFGPASTRFAALDTNHSCKQPCTGPSNLYPRVPST